MKPSLISCNRLKISVSAEELLGKDYRQAEERNRICKFVSEACRQTGFASSTSRLMIEALPAKGGGLTICLTRLPGRRTAKLHTRKGVREMGSEPYIFEFSSLEHMLAAGRALMNHQQVLLDGICVIFRKGKWYICFSPLLIGLDGYRLDCLLGCMSEFGNEVAGGLIKQAQLKENGQTVAENENAERLFYLTAQSAASSAPSFSDCTADGTDGAPNT